jgi:hypothetical protein
MLWVETNPSAFDTRSSNFAPDPTTENRERIPERVPAGEMLPSVDVLSVTIEKASRRRRIAVTERATPVPEFRTLAT